MPSQGQKCGGPLGLVGVGKTIVLSAEKRRKLGPDGYVVHSTIVEDGGFAILHEYATDAASTQMTVSDLDVAPLTPTVPDSSFAPTEVDPTEEDPDSDADSLLDLLMRTNGLQSQPARPRFAAMSSDSFDSQATENDNPSERQTDRPGLPLPPLTPEPHWTDDSKFWTSMEDRLAMCYDCQWYRLDFFSHAPVHFSPCFEAACNFIRASINNVWLQYKIGITEDPYIRWTRPDCGYEHFGWQYMCLLYTAPTSKTSKRGVQTEQERLRRAESTGAMEKRLIAEFSLEPGCLNRVGAGGEYPSDGCPHFVYVVVRDDDRT